MARYLSMTLILMGLWGCAPPVIDATNQETYRQSIEKVLRQLPEERQREFKDALRALLFSGEDVATTIPDEELLSPSPDAMAKLGGLTGEQVIFEATQLRITKIRAAIDELAKKQRRDEAIRAEMSAIQVDVTSVQENTNHACEVTISAVNGLGRRVGSIYLDLALVEFSTEGGSIKKNVTHRDELWFFFGGGMAPEAKRTSTATLTDSSMCARFREALIEGRITHEIRKIADTRRNTLLELAFTKADARRLKELEEALLRLLDT